MKTTHAVSRRKDVVAVTAACHRHDKKRLASWRILGATVEGFPAFRWQLTRVSSN